MFDYLVNYLLIGKLLGPALRNLEEQVRARRQCPLFIADYWVQCNPSDPSRPLATKAQDKRQVPIVSTIEERLEMLDGQRRVIFSLASSQSVTSLDGPVMDPKTVALNLPEYRADRMVVVYPEVLDWVEQRCKRPTDDLMTFGEIRTFEINEDEAVITCGELRGVVRESEESSQRLTSVRLAQDQTILMTEPELETPLFLDIADVLDSVEPLECDRFDERERNAIYQTKGEYQLV